MTSRARFVAPSVRDPRLHTAAVILTVHTVGITALGFRVSIPQILSAILTAAAVDVVIAFRQTGQIVWPASGMLTGSGVALILRMVEMEAGNFWAWTDWYVYAAVAGISVLTKHVIRWRGSHLFNPSNVGLVAVFLILGRGRVEPLDFWWAPLGPWMLLAYAVIVVGGVLITRRLALLEMALTFWLVLGAGLAVLSGAGHCMVAAWAPEAVCGWQFWQVLVTSPEVLIFMLFMITDPKTIPSDRRARVWFAAALGLLATLLIAPNGDEYGAKVGLLASLVILSPIRSWFDRLASRRHSRAVSPRAAFVRGVGVGFGLAMAGLVIAAAGLPARDTATAVASTPEIEVEFDSSSLPEVVTDPEVESLDLEETPADLARFLAENLAIEALAVRRGDASLLAASSTGDRLAAMLQRIDDAVIGGDVMVDDYRFETLHLGLAELGEGQASAALEFRVTGRIETLVRHTGEDGDERLSTPLEGSFMLRRVGDRWLIAQGP